MSPRPWPSTGDIAVISWHQHSLSDERVLEIDRCHPDAARLYAIGGYPWTWRITRPRRHPAAR